MKLLKIFLLGVYLLGNEQPIFAQNPTQEPDTIKIRFRRYTMKKYFHQEKKQFVFEVYRENQWVYGVSAAKFSHLQYVAINGMATFDLEKDSINNFIIQEYRGGEREQTIWHILNLARNETPLLGKITADFSVPWLSDLDADGIFELLVKDYTFANWNADFLDSPYQTVVLHPQSDGYRLVEDFMKKDSLQYAESVIETVKTTMQTFYEEATRHYPYKANVLAGKPNERWGFIPPILWATMLDLIYAGKANLAWELVEKSWFEKLEGKAVFIADFKQQLQQSPFWDDLKKLNNNQLN